MGQSNEKCNEIVDEWVNVYSHYTVNGVPPRVEQTTRWGYIFHPNGRKFDTGSKKYSYKNACNNWNEPDDSSTDSKYTRTGNFYQAILDSFYCKKLFNAGKSMQEINEHHKFMKCERFIESPTPPPITPPTSSTTETTPPTTPPTSSTTETTPPTTPPASSPITPPTSSTAETTPPTSSTTLTQDILYRFENRVKYDYSTIPDYLNLVNELPPNWERFTDETTGKYYYRKYYDQNTVTWERPITFSEAVYEVYFEEFENIFNSYLSEQYNKILIQDFNGNTEHFNLKIFVQSLIDHFVSLKLDYFNKRNKTTILSDLNNAETNISNLQTNTIDYVNETYHIIAPRFLNSIYDASRYFALENINNVEIKAQSMSKPPLKHLKIKFDKIN